MRTKTLDLMAITVESFYTVGGAALSDVEPSSGCTESDHAFDGAFTDLCSVTCDYSCNGTCDSCGYSCDYCQTDETDCSTYCFKATYVWEAC